MQAFSLETLEIDIPVEDENFNIVEREYSTEKFVFQNKRLEVAFYNLSMKHQRILEMIYVSEMAPGEAAAELDCRPQQIYDAHYQAIKKLRAALLK